MSENLQEPPGLTIARTRVYFDPETGQIIHVHRIASAGPLTDKQVAEESDAFATSIEHATVRTRQRRRRGVRAVAAVNPDVLLKVDVAGRRLVRDS